MDIEAKDVNCISFVFAQLGIIEEERFIEPGLTSELIDPYFRRVPLPEQAVVFAYIAANNMVYHMGLLTQKIVLKFYIDQCTELV